MNKLFTKHEHQSDKIYEGIRFQDGTTTRGKTLVTVNQSPLYSLVESEDEDTFTDAYEWGNRSSKAENLARSILTDYFEDDTYPRELTFLFKKQFVSALPFDGWKLESRIIEDWLMYLQKLLEDEKRYEENYDYFGDSVNRVGIA